jgi:hypothetical protein
MDWHDSTDDGFLKAETFKEVCNSSIISLHDMKNLMSLIISILSI